MFVASYLQRDLNSIHMAPMVSKVQCAKCAPPDVLLSRASCDSLLPGEVLALCFLFLLPSPLAGLPPFGLLLLRGPELMVPGVALPFCTKPTAPFQSASIWHFSVQ